MQKPIAFYKKLNGFFNSESDQLLMSIAKEQRLDKELVEDLMKIKNLIKSLTFRDMMSLLTKHGMPRDTHVFPQYRMKSFRISEYNHIFNLQNFSCFESWYESTTGKKFNLRFNKTQPNNRLVMKKFDGNPKMNVEELQKYKLDDMTPRTGSLICKESKKMILDIYYKDHDLDIISKRSLSS